MKTYYCLRCACEIKHHEPRICRPCAVAVQALFATGEWILTEVNFDQACVSCGAIKESRILHGPGEFTWCENCIQAGTELPELEGPSPPTDATDSSGA